MTTEEKKNRSGHVLAILAGGGIGILFGTALGIGLALLSGAFADGMGWFVVFHATLAAMLMGGWTAPCFVNDDKIEAG